MKSVYERVDRIKIQIYIVQQLSFCCKQLATHKTMIFKRGKRSCFILLNR